MKPLQRRCPTPAAIDRDITRLLSKPCSPESMRLVLEWAYPQLHDIAIHCCRDERPGRSLGPTILANETCVKFLESDQDFKNRAYFFTAAATMMRRYLIQAARTRSSQRRGGDWQRVDFKYAEQLGFEEPHELLDFDSALKRLEKVCPAWSQMAHLRVFGGLSTAGAAALLKIAESTARRRWAQARAWLRRDLSRAA